MNNKDNLKPLFADPLSRDYTFVQQDGSDLHARESMADTQYSYSIPAHLMWVTH